MSLFQISTTLAWILEIWMLASCAWLTVLSADSACWLGCGLSFWSGPCVSYCNSFNRLRSWCHSRQRQMSELVFQQPKVDLRVGMSANKDMLRGLYFSEQRLKSWYLQKTDFRVGVSVDRDKLQNWYLKKADSRVGILTRQTSELVF